MKNDPNFSSFRFFKTDMSFEKIQTKLYKKLVTKAREFLHNNKLIATTSQVKISRCLAL